MGAPPTWAGCLNLLPVTSGMPFPAGEDSEAYRFPDGGQGTTGSSGGALGVCRRLTTFGPGVAAVSRPLVAWPKPTRRRWRERSSRRWPSRESSELMSARCRTARPQTELVDAPSETNGKGPLGEGGGANRRHHVKPRPRLGKSRSRSCANRRGVRARREEATMTPEWDESCRLLSEFKMPSGSSKQLGAPYIWKGR